MNDNILYCPKCGAVLDRQTTVCQNCGKDLSMYFTIINKEKEMEKIIENDEELIKLDNKYALFGLFMYGSIFTCLLSMVVLEPFMENTEFWGPVALLMIPISIIFGIISFFVRKYFGKKITKTLEEKYDFHV